MKHRTSGILTHISSLPSGFGIGDFGPDAYRFADFLARTGQSVWQVLPLTPTDPGFGNSPYSSISAFAGNHLFISPELLLEEGLLEKKDLSCCPKFPERSVKFTAVIRFKNMLLWKAYENFRQGHSKNRNYLDFCRQNKGWLDDYALFVALKKAFGGKTWNEWPKELRDRRKDALVAATGKYRDKINEQKFLQFIFNKQWNKLRKYCNERSVKLVGDIPIYVSFDSADVWKNPEVFKLDKKKKPLYVAGVPPDYFSRTGQLWGNPVYNWARLKKDGFSWWIDRIAHNLRMFDLIRIDHFRGLVAYWEVPSRNKTAKHGKWARVPAEEFFTVLKKRFPSLPIIAEDLGFITDDVREIIRRYNLPGMKILQFAFLSDEPDYSYLPHNIPVNCVVYTGTHDNNTTRGWYEHDLNRKARRNLEAYIGKKVNPQNVSWALIRLAMATVADMVITPMQDILSEGANARMNMPSVMKGNWSWRFRRHDITLSMEKMLRNFTVIYGRN